jgi:hypothetical protein
MLPRTKSETRKIKFGSKTEGSFSAAIGDHDDELVHIPFGPK